MTTTSEVTYEGEVLKGQYNYIRWKREFLVRSDTEGLTQLIFIPNTSEAEEIVRQPKLPILQTLTEEVEKLLGSEENIRVRKKELNSEYRDAIEIYKFESQTYDKQQERICKLKKLIINSVDNTIQPQISDKTPMECWKFLKETYEMPDSLAQGILYQQLREVKLNPSQSVPEYITQIQNLVLDLASTGEQVTEKFVFTTILGGLPAQYNHLVEQVHFDEAIGTNITKHTADLDTSQNKKWQLPECPTCKKRHPGGDAECWFKHPEKDPYKTNKKPVHPKCPTCKKRHPGGDAECWFKNPEKDPYKTNKKPSHPECPTCKKRHLGADAECWFKHPEKNPFK